MHNNFLSFFTIAIITVISSCGQSLYASKFKTLMYLYEISGTKTIAGIHNREPNAIPNQWTNNIQKLTGKYPGLWSGDFLFQKENINNRQIMINEAVAQWHNGALVNIMWHACNPALNEPCGWDELGVMSQMSDDEWKELTTEGTSLNIKWKSQVDEISSYLVFLQEQEIEILWRPFHEMNQKVFWWGGRPGPEGTVRLYQMLHDYLTNEKKITNLIWVWDIQDFDTLESDVHLYNPGDKYWDVLALDIYNDNTGFSKEKYDIIVEIANGKPIGIGECQILPTIEELKEQPKWTFFMGWSELVFEKNSENNIKIVFGSENVLTLDEMPGWEKARKQYKLYTNIF